MSQTLPGNVGSERAVRFDPNSDAKTPGLVGRGTTILSKLLFKGKSQKYNESDIQSEDELEGGDSFDASSVRKTRTMRQKRGKSKGSIQAELKAEEEARQRELQESLTVSERSYLPVHVRGKLLELKGLPPTPHTEGSRGVVLFADISGFTNLGKELRTQMTALEAASKLANRICTVLRELTDICHEYEGDVAKFAGDALLCVWENHDDQYMLERAKACAVSMLNKIKDVDSQLDLHGGIAMGNILHCHLGDKRQELLWYLLTGDAVVRAANLVDEAPRGQILYEPRRAASTVTDEGPAKLDHKLERLPSTLAYECLTKESKTMIMPILRKQRSRGEDEMPLSSPADPLGQGRRLSSDFHEAENHGTRARTSTEDDPFLNMRITPRGRSYIPRALKNILMSGRIESGEMRSRVAILFAALPSLVLGDDEIVANELSDERKRLLNDTFAHISTILRQLDGAFRDLLFDDKGCIFIAVFGAYGAIEMPELKALKAARRMEEELAVDDLKIGLSVGTCFVGLVGNDVRHDMIVMGHEVNMSARYMSKAPLGTILVSPRIQKVTSEFFKFEEVLVELKKPEVHHELQKNVSATRLEHRFEQHDNDLIGDGTFSRRDSEEYMIDPNGMAKGYRPVKELPKRGSFTTTYRYLNVIPDQFFVGRKNELQKLQSHMNKASITKTSNSLCMVSGPRGYGKSWLIREFRHRNDDKFSSALGVAFELNVLTPLYVFRQIFERLFEIFDGMPKGKATTVLASWSAAGIKADAAVIQKVFPYMAKYLPQNRRNTLQQSGGSVSARFGRLIGSVRLSSSPLNLDEDPSNGVAKPALKKLPSAAEVIERTSSGAVPVNPVVEELRQAGSDGSKPTALGTAALPTPSTVLQIQRVNSTSASPKLDPMSSAPRLISTRNLLEGVKKSSTGNVFLTVSQPPALALVAPTLPTAPPSQPAPSPTLTAQAAQAPPTVTLSAQSSEKKILARKASRVEMNLVMGKKELDPLVKFISGLLELNSNETIKVGKKGLIVVVEDLQWLDAVSLQVFTELLEKMKENPKGFLPNVYFIASCRNPDPDKPEEDYYSSNPSDIRPFLERNLLQCFKDTKLFTSIELDVLSRDEVDSLVSKCLIKNSGEVVSSEVLDLIFNNSGGMPNAIEDIIQLIRKYQGAVYLDIHSNQWKWRSASKTGNNDGGDSILREARQAFVLRIDNLSLATRDLLKIAGCVCDDKQKFKLPEIVDVIKRDLENKSRYLRADTHEPSGEYIADKLQEAVSAGLLKHRRAGIFSATEEWAFASYAIAGTVRDMVPMDRLKEIRGVKEDLDKEKTGQAAEGLFREFLGNVG